MNPIFDHVVNDVKERFSSNKHVVSYVLSMFVPDESMRSERASDSNMKKQLLEITSEYGFAVESFEILEGDLRHWCKKWQKSAQLPESALQALNLCKPDVYPNINRLLQFLCSLPVSVAAAERSFSTLRLVKDWMRSTMTETRLSGLALMYIHRQIMLEINLEKIIDRFAKKNKRRLSFVV